MAYSRKRYTPPSRTELHLHRFARWVDGAVELRLNRLESYLLGRWPALSRWLSG